MKKETKPKPLPKREAIKLDALLKDLFSVTKRALIQLLNGVFDETYDESQVDITITNNEFVGSDLENLRGDILYVINRNGEKVTYHIEFQLSKDNKMEIRLFQYAVHKGLEERNLGWTAIVKLPYQRVIYFEENGNIPNELQIIFESPDGNQQLDYRVPIIKNWELTVEYLVRKKMYPLLPLQLFNLRKEMYGLEKFPSKMQPIVEKMKNTAFEILRVTSELYDTNELDKIDYDKMMVAVQNLIDYFNDNFLQDEYLSVEVREMTTSIIGPMEERAIAKGRAEGIAEGKAEVIIKALKKGFGLEEIMDLTDVDRDSIMEIKEHYGL